MPVTTKAQRSAESGESENSVKHECANFFAKLKKSAKNRDNLKGLLFLPAEPFGRTQRRVVTGSLALSLMLCAAPLDQIKRFPRPEGAQYLSEPGAVSDRIINSTQLKPCNLFSPGFVTHAFRLCSRDAYWTVADTVATTCTDGVLWS